MAPERITPTELATIRDRHPNIQQPTLEEHDDEPQTQDTDETDPATDPTGRD